MNTYFNIYTCILQYYFEQKQVAQEIKEFAW